MARQETKQTGRPSQSEQEPGEAEKAPVVGRTLWDIVNWRILTAAALTMLLGVIALLALGFVELTYDDNGFKVTPKTIKWARDEQANALEQKKRIELGRKLNKDYVLDGVTMVINLRRIETPTGSKMLAEFRTNYAVYPLKSFQTKDAKFREKYDTTEALITRVPGSEREVDETDGGYRARCI